MKTQTFKVAISQFRKIKTDDGFILEKSSERYAQISLNTAGIENDADAKRAECIALMTEKLQNYLIKQFEMQQNGKMVISPLAKSHITEIELTNTIVDSEYEYLNGVKWRLTPNQLKKLFTQQSVKDTKQSLLLALEWIQ